MKIENTFKFTGKSGTYISTKILKKSGKGIYKNDIIRLRTKSMNGTKNQFDMTPFEALLIANGLISAITMFESKNGKIGLLK